jgi:hypothetical protein
VAKFVTGIFHIVVARKPLSKGTIAENCLRHGCGALNIDGTRIGTEDRPLLEHTGRSGKIYGAGLEGSRSIGETTLGRWPANLVVGGEETVRKFPVVDGRVGMTGKTGRNKSIFAGFTYQDEDQRSTGTADSGSAARFFFNFAEQESDEG